MQQHDEQQRPTAEQEHGPQANVVSQGDPSVFPPGYRRDEQMAERADNLAEQADQMNAKAQIGVIDPSTFVPDPEIRHAISMDALHVSNKQPDYEYKWVRDTNSVNGGPSQAVLKEISRSILVNGKVYPTWEVVRGDMPEASERKNVLGARQVGDVVLLRCHKNAFAVIQQQELQKRINQDESVAAGLEDKALQAGAPIHNYTQAQAANLAKQQFNGMLKSGTIPGMPASGR